MRRSLLTLWSTRAILLSTWKSSTLAAYKDSSLCACAREKTQSTSLLSLLHPQLRMHTFLWRFRTASSMTLMPMKPATKKKPKSDHHVHAQNFTLLFSRFDLTAPEMTLKASSKPPNKVESSLFSFALYADRIFNKFKQTKKHFFTIIH